MLNSVPFITTIALILISIGKCSYQPLELDQPITLTAQYDGVYLSYPVSRSLQRNVLFCFAQRSVKVSQATSNIQSTIGSVSKCSFQKQSSEYFCLYLYSQNNLFKYETFSKQLTDLWTADTNVMRWWDSLSQTKTASSLTTQKDKTNQAQNKNESKLSESPIQTSNTSTTTPTIIIHSYSFQQIAVIQNYFKNQSFYHMYTCPEYNRQTNECQQLWKQNYVHTFNHSQKKINLIVQRRHYCGMFKQFDQQIVNHVFYGGTLRQGNYHMFFAILNYLTNTSQQLNMWGGISYSIDHANRDMFCYDTDGANFDAASLIAGAIYKDIAPNINGKQSTQIVDSFYSEQKQKYIYFIQYHRPYQTYDRVGDQTLFRKIYDQFAFAARFEYISSPNNNTLIIAPSCLKQQHYHNFLMSFQADVSVYENILIWGIILVIYIIFV